MDARTRSPLRLDCIPPRYRAEHKGCRRRRSNETRRSEPMLRNMRVAILGAGAIGGALAAILTRAGHEVEVVARGANLEVIHASGIRLVGIWGDYVARVSAVERLTVTPQLVIVATKAADAPEIIAANEEFLRGIPVVVVQNGLEGISAAADAAPQAHIVGALAVFAASYLHPGEMRITTGGPLFLGTEPGGSDAPAETAASVLRSILDVVVVQDFVGAQWTKLVVNQINAIPAITGLSAQEVIADRSLRRVLTASIRENVRVARARGIRFASVSGLGNTVLCAVGVAPPWIAQLLPLAMGRRMGATPNLGSTQQSIRRGQPTEIDFLNGAVVTAAAGTPVNTTVNAALTAMVHEVETSGIFFTAAEVVARAR